MCRGIKHRSGQRLRIIREHIRDNDQPYREERVRANGLQELRDEGIRPVCPGWVDDGHEERGEGAEEGCDGNNPVGGDAVYEEADYEVDEHADDQAGEDADRGAEGTEGLDFLEAV